MELPKSYDPKSAEDRIYNLWQESGFFNPDNLPGKRKEKFFMILPPPNVTGVLHMGHALTLAIEDIFVRFNRMRGKKVLWLPGTDHASIATETKFLKENEIRKSDYAGSEKRNEFINLVNDFALRNQSVIIGQLKAMGGSLDWSRLRYTLDNESSYSVEEAFIRMHKEGLIYMGKGKVINWDPKSQTVVSDEEIEYESGKATLYTFRYSKDFPIAISTTRPETKVGDTAVAVHPDDARYKQYIGKTYDVIFFSEELSIRIVGDPQVDPLFGTGALGVTPAHSIVDEEIASRHSLPSRQVINELARMSQNLNPLIAGKKTIEARQIIVSYLKEQGLIEKEEIIDQNIPKAQRSGGIIEQIPKRHQFFVNVNKKISERGGKTLKDLMRETIVKGKIKIIPEYFTKTYLNWIDNLRDWSISRQIWYGHRLPIWYEAPAPLGDDLEYEVSRTRPTRPPAEGKEWEQFSDTLDTWFSSALWTFSTLGWPKETNDLKIYHPADVMETGYDILFFWVAKMILMSTFLINNIPFKSVYLHGLVRDEQRRKMSKSLGNTINPLDMTEKYGTDALRMALIFNTAPGTDLPFSEEKIRGMRNFANKLWNIARFISENAKDADLNVNYTKEDKNVKNYFDKIILKNVTKNIEFYRLNLAAETLYQYIWHKFADMIIEHSKTIFKDGTEEEKKSRKKLLISILEEIIKLLHPFMPFVTEEIYQNLALKNKKESLMVEDWPALH